MVTRYVDALGRETRFSYNESGDLTETVNPDGTSTHTNWTVVGGKHVPLTQVDEAGNATTYSYDASANATCVVDPIGYKVEMAYGPQGQLLTRKDKRGFTTSYEYESGTGNLIRTVDPLGNAATQAYDQVGNVVAVTDRRGATTEFEYDGLRRRTKVVAPPGQDGQRAVTQLEYNQRGLVTKVIDPLGNAATSRYEPYGRLIETVDALGATSRREYDAAGRLVRTIDPRGNATTLVVDSVDRVVGTVDARGHAASSTLDAEGEVLARRDASGTVTSYGRDARGHLLSVLGADGGTRTFEYDARGLQTASVDAAGRRVEYGIDAVGRTVVERRFLSGQALERHYTFDPSGNLSGVVDEAGRARLFTTDAQGRVVAETDPAGGVRRREYDADGRLLRMLDEKGAAWTFGYDGAGRLVSRADPLGNETTYKFDLGGRLIKARAPNGQLTTYQHDVLGRVSRVDFADGEWSEVGYDVAGNATVVRGAAAGGPLVEVARAFDELNRVTSVTDSFVQRRFEYGYAPGGQRSSMSLVNQVSGATEQTVGYEWDSMGRLARMVPRVGNPIEYSYDAAGLRSRVILPNAIVANYSHDDLGRLNELEYRDATGHSLGLFRYTRDLAGNPLSMVDVEGLTQYAYDQLDRLTEARYPDGTWERFAYDSSGRRVRLDDELGATEYSYNLADQLLSESGVRNATYQWDTRGNLLSKSDSSGAVQYRWSARGKLAGVECVDGRTLSYAYAPLGDLRIASVDGAGVAHRFVWDGYNCVSELDGSNAAVAGYLEGIGLDEHLGTSLGSGLFTLLGDPVGSVRGVADSAGALVNSYTYRAFGTVRASSEAAPVPLRFAGLMWDGEASQSYARARWLRPDTGAFISRDRLTPGEPAYSYAAANPLTNTDPTGDKIQVVPSVGPRYNRETYKEWVRQRLLQYTGVTYGYEGDYLTQPAVRVLCTPPDPRWWLQKLTGLPSPGEVQANDWRPIIDALLGERNMRGEVVDFAVRISGVEGDVLLSAAAAGFGGGAYVPRRTQSVAYYHFAGDVIMAQRAIDLGVWEGQATARIMAEELAHAYDEHCRGTSTLPGTPERDAMETYAKNLKNKLYWVH